MLSYPDASLDGRTSPDFGAVVMAMFYRHNYLSSTLALALTAGLIAGPASEAPAQRASDVIGAGAAGVAIGLILGGAAAQQQQQQQQQQQPRERAYRPTRSSTRSANGADAGPTMSKVEIEKTQENLNILGYDVGTVDGSLGQKTVRAIKKFQADNKFSQTGRLSPAEQKVLQAQVETKQPTKTAEAIRTPNSAPDQATADQTTKSATPDPKLESLHWDTVRNSTIPEEIEDYIAKFPAGQFKTVAEIRLKQLREKQVIVVPGNPGPTEGPPTTWPAIDDNAFPKARQRRADAVAVIIGNSAYANDVPKVDFSLRDAEALKLLAMKTLGIESENVILLKDATRAQMERVFGNERENRGELWRRIDPDGHSDVFVFYSGHGVPSVGEKAGPLLLPVDADPKMQTYNGYPLDLLYKNLGDLKTKSMTVFLDACFSGQAPDSNTTSLIKNASPVFISAPTPSASTKINLFAAAGDRQLSSWDTNAGFGLFTRYVLSGIAGEAVENKKKEVTAKELSDYISKNVRKQARRLYGREQEPSFTGDPDFVISTFN